MGIADDIYAGCVRGVQDVVHGNGDQPGRIAIIGTEGSGKTIFIAALAKQIDSRVQSGWLLDPKNMQTQRYIEETWAQLCRGDWPRFTQQAAFHELDWNLHAPNAGVAKLRLVDASGHRFRELFTGDLATIPEHLSELAQYCRSADVVVVLINMQDFLGEANGELRSYNELALKFAFDFVQEAGSGMLCCAVFTQIDHYPELAAQHGGKNGVAQAFLPKLWGAHFRDGRVPIFAVAAVDQTEVRPDEQGTPRRFPAKGFSSHGYEPLLEWLQTSLMKLKEQRFWGDILYRLRGAAIPVGVLIGALAIWLFAISPVLSWWMRQPSPEVIDSVMLTETTGVFDVDYKYEFRASVLNRGATGNVRMVISCTCGQWHDSKVIERVVAAGQVDKGFSYQTPWLPDATTPSARWSPAK